MFRNYLITALRNFSRHKLYSFINIAGLTVGLTCAIFIILFVRDQLSYDRWIPETENLYRVEVTFHMPGQPSMRWAWAGFPITQAMVDNIPEVTARTRLTPESVTVLSGGHAFAESVNIVDTNFFDVIKLPLMAGNPKMVFAQPDSVVLSEAGARKYFGGAPVLGKSITISANYCDDLGQECQTRTRPMLVTGIMRDLPHNTQLRGDIFFPNTSLANPMSEEQKRFWLGGHSYGYVRLAPGTDTKVVLAKLRKIIDQTVDPKGIGNVTMRGSEALNPHLVLFQDDHLATDRYIPRPMTAPGSWALVYGFIAVGALILLIAGFNFVNLATARAMTRIREISLRKAMGARRRQVAIQFLGESVLTVMVALVLALGISEILWPAFDLFVDAPISFHYLDDWPLLLLLIAIAIVIGLASGIYPALILSGFRPAGALRSAGAARPDGGLTRTFLVVLQFAVSIGLGIVAAVIFSQTSFARNLNLGLQKSDIIIVDVRNVSPGTGKNIADALRANPDVLGAAISGSIPFVNDHSNWDVHAPGRPAQLFRIVQASPDFIRLYGIKLLKGRTLSESYGKDASGEVGGEGNSFNVLINEAGARSLGYSPDNAVGQTFYLHTSPATIVGLIADAKLDGPQSPVLPTIYIYQPGLRFWYMSVRIRRGNLAQVLPFIDATWHRLAPDTAISRHFLNESFESLFLADDRQGAVFTLFVCIAIFIASLGLFGLAAFSTERRTKEIGIRKTFGARTRDVVLLLLWQFSIPVLIANLIAWPVAYYYLHGWLEGYAYRINLSPLYFIGAGAVALVIAWATVILHAAHVARANPIHALRYE